MKRFVVFAALAFAPLACGQLKLNVFDKLKPLAKDSTNINLPKGVIDFAGGIFGDKGDSAKMKKLIEGLSSVLVQSLEFEKEGVYSDADVKQIIAEMGGPGWNLTVSSDEKHKSGTEVSRIWIKTGGNGELGGLRILSAEPKELSVIEIIGKISLKDMGDLGGIIPQIASEHIGKPDKKKEE